MPTEKILKLIDSVNIAKDLSEDKLIEISERVLSDLREDEKSMEDWLEYADKAMELTQLEREEKHFPFKNSANIKYPLITTAVIQFSSRTLPELIKNGEVAKFKIIGHDPDRKKERRGRRIKTHLNYQIMEKMPNWMDERDRLHHQLAVVGTSYSKTWYDPIEGVNRSELIPYDQIVVNNNIKNLESAPRISQYVYMTTNEIVEHLRYELFSLPEDMEAKDLEMDLTDHDAVYHELVEQHTFLDLDEDGYEEPYIVMVHRASTKVLRITARYTADDVVYNARNQIKKIYPTHYFTDYHFIPNPDGTFHSMGFGTLLLDMNATVNTILNQLINAGHLATIQGGIIGKDLKIRKEDFDIEPGEWIYADSATGTSLKDSIVPFNYKEPSMVLFQLLGTLVESSQRLTSTTDSLTGTGDTTNVSPNTLMALIQQGLKVYSAIQRRIFRGFKKELQKLVKLNQQNVNIEEYLALIDPSEEELKEMFNMNMELLDYNLKDVDIVPVVDNNTATEAENLARSQTEISVALQLAPYGVVNLNEVARNAFYAIETPNVEKIVLPEQPPAPDPKAIEIQSKIDKTAKELQMQNLELQLKSTKIEAEVQELKSRALKNIADAEAAEVGSQLEVYKQQLASVDKVLDREMEAKKMQLDYAKQGLPAPTKESAKSDSADDDFDDELKQLAVLFNEADVEQEAKRRGLI